MRTVIITTLNDEQLAYLRNLATENGITAEFIVEGTQIEEPVTSSTPLTGAMLDQIASTTGKTMLEIASMASQYSITTVEDALANSEIPSSVKELLESYL